MVASPQSPAASSQSYKHDITQNDAAPGGAK
jgi:hypothetical protein